ncbi:MAG TPA: ion channel [Flavisolibacter sp.]|jgi:inward rectifier potassium channel|nr:ion channel [Flavisolibacter sp.]
MANQKQNLTSELTTGFGERSNQSGGRFYRKDGKVNVVRKGVGFFDRLSWYHTMLELPRWKFWLILLMTYIVVNCLFAFVYFGIGVEHLDGIEKGKPLYNYIQAFFFSAQTFTTVGYGHVSPSGLTTSAVATFEAFLGVLTLALASGLFYGRFSMPRSFLKFSDKALIAPYKDGTALMFRMAPYKNNHLMDAEVKMTIGLRQEDKNRFYTLNVEFSKINSLVLNWTVVHPITEESPLYGMNLEDIKQSRAEILVYIKAFDEGFANTVVARSSYAAEDIVEGARFLPMYGPAPAGNYTILDLGRLNAYEKVQLPVSVRQA